MLLDALQDLKSEAIAGQTITDDLIAEVAAEYSINPAFLTRSWRESYPHPELLAQTAAATSEVAQQQRDVTRGIEELRAFYRGTFIEREAFFKSERYIVLGRTSSTRYLAVRKSDGTQWTLPASQTKFA